VTEILDEANRKKMEGLGNEFVMKKVEDAIRLCKPDKVTVITDSDEDVAYVREKAIQCREEQKLATEGHTIHYDGYHDQARDKEKTKYLLPEGKTISRYINSTEREAGLKEVMGFLDGSMKGKEMLVRFFCLGPTNSKFSISALQITDSFYVCHSEDILYRKGYEQFKKLDKKDKFFSFLHSAGQLDERGNSINVDKRRIYIDLETNSVFTVNNQYAGNSVGLKKLAMRLAIKKGSEEGWMTEHMFIMGVNGKDKQGNPRRTYLTGAFPSACGKTSTAMIPGQTIVADDIAYLREWEDGKLHGVNVEQGIFGIIRDVSPKDDPIIYKALTTPRETIFSNVLVVDGRPYWLGMGQALPEKGTNFSGEWYEGKTDSEGNEIPAAHKNARYTIRLRELDNVDEQADDPNGVPIAGFIFGGRDSDTSVPVAESLSWPHGVFMAASVESETTAATLGKEGELKHSPMANLDFISIPFGRYIDHYLKIGKHVKKPPMIFSVNYFLKDQNGKYYSEILDKQVWILWMEGRINGDYEAIKTPIGYIPKHEDIQALFKQVFNKEFSKDDYEKQFSIRLAGFLEKFERIENIFKHEPGMPGQFTQEMSSQIDRLKQARDKFGKDIIGPFEFER
jgi:phosphoenolpyruvate carboxykinase (GTP)